MKHLWNRWCIYFFSSSDPFDLAIARILFFGGIALLYVPADFRLWATVSHVFWMPVSLLAIPGIGILPAATIGILQVIWKISLVFTCIGLLTPISAAIAAIVGVYLLGLQNSMGKTDHFDAIVVFICLVFAVAKPTPVWSVDGSWRARHRPSSPPPASGEYTWPIKSVWLLMALIFFASGFSKLRHSGFSWVTSQNMAIMLVKQHYWASPVNPTLNAGLWIASQPWLYHSLAAATLALELCYPLALLSPFIRWIVVPSMMLTQIGIFLVMGPSFPQFLLANAFWVPWNRLRKKILRPWKI